MILIRNYLILCTFILAGMLLPDFFLDYNIYTQKQFAGMYLYEFISYILGRILFYWIIPVGIFKSLKPKILDAIASAVSKRLPNSQSDMPAKIS